VRKLTFFLVGAAAVVGGVVAIGSVSAAPVRGGLPKLQVGPSCDAAARGSVILGRNKEACLADETTAQDTLKQKDRDAADRLLPRHHHGAARAASTAARQPGVTATPF
jgi:hypothetical protein